MNKAKEKKEKRTTRQRRIRSRVVGTKERPRLSIFRSNKNISAQIIDDTKGETNISVSSANVKGANPMEKAKAVGTEVAKIAKNKKIEKVVFDRGGYIYTGKVKALAEGAREGGLDF